MKTAAEAIEDLAATDARFSRAALKEADPAGLGRAFFQAVVERLGRDPGAALRLAKRWRVVLARASDSAFAIRARAVGERIEARWAQSALSFLEASRLAPDADGRVAMRLGAVDSLGRAGRFDEAYGLGRCLYRSAGKLGDDALAGRVALNVANALVWADRHRESGRWYGRALTRLPLDSRAERASANLGLAAALLLSDVRACAERAAEARSAFEAFGMTHYAALADITLAQADAIRGLHDTARRRLVALRELFPPESVERARIEQFLGDAYRQLGLRTEARDAYQAALSSAALRTLPFNALIAHMGLADLDAAEGRYAEARNELRAAYRTARAKGNGLWVATAATMLGELALQTGEPRAAKGRALEALGRLAGLRSGVYHLRARLLLAAARQALGESAADDLADARRVLGIRGYVFDRWRIHHLEASERTGGRRRNAQRRMLRAMLEERALRTSLVARRAFFADKEKALAEYMADLLDRPTPTSIREALDVIGKTRCVTLLDEIVAARRGELAQARTEELELLRRRITEASDDRLEDEGIRRTRPANGLGRLRRQWAEQVEQVLGLAPNDAPAADGATCTFLGSDLYQIENGDVSVLRGMREPLERSLRWLWFDLTARESPADRVYRAVAELDPMLPAGGLVAPDGILWSVPWGLAGFLAGREVEVAVHPSFRVRGTSLDSHARVLLLAGSRPDLPNVDQEVRDVCARFPSVHVCRTVEAVRGAATLGAWDVVHVAAHASADRENPMFSAIYLDDGPLCAAELATLGLRARFAFLDACDTGRMSLEQRSEPAGLVRALLAAGPSAVVANAWQVDDEAAPLFARNLYDAVLGGRTLAEAMRSARCAVRRKYPHPYYWGPFTLFAGYQTEREAL